MKKILLPFIALVLFSVSTSFAAPYASTFSEDPFGDDAEMLYYPPAGTPGYYSTPSGSYNAPATGEPASSCRNGIAT